MIGLDQDIVMAMYPIEYIDYGPVLLKHLQSYQLTPCGHMCTTIGGIIRTDEGSLFPRIEKRRKKHKNSRLQNNKEFQTKRQLRRIVHKRYSAACRYKNGTKDHMIAANKQCLSLKTSPQFISTNVNYYNISDNPQFVWRYPPVYSFQVAKRENVNNNKE